MFFLIADDCLEQAIQSRHRALRRRLVPSAIAALLGCYRGKNFFHRRHFFRIHINIELHFRGDSFDGR
jgi:hypothetical protein